MCIQLFVCVFALELFTGCAPSFDGLHHFVRHVLCRRVFPKRIDKLSVRVHEVEKDTSPVALRQPASRLASLPD